VIHASAVARGDLVYLFLGASGAGKSTVAETGAGLGYRVIHDDRVIIHPIPSGEYLVTKFSEFPSDARLGGIFSLIQSKDDALLPLSSIQTANKLFESYLDFGLRSIMVGQVLQLAFSMSAAIARRIPGYELHFRKSPDFWKLIDEQFPD
jgi:energy-coupling factor transporter ATP-binding protein EcfA2